MSKFDDSVLVPELGAQVINVLSKYQALPSWGLLAGQAVASALDELLGTGTPVYNDIDWFVPQDEWTVNSQGWFESRSSPEKSTLRVSALVKYEALEEELDFDGYGTLRSVAKRPLYTVAHAEEQGMLNKIEVAWDYCAKRQRENMPLDLIRVFDTNNVQASLDLATGRLTVTQAYREFFRTRQLKLVSVFTPLQSLLRFLKKLDELPSVYANVAVAQDLVTRMVRANEGSRALTHLRQEAFRAGKAFISPADLGEIEKLNGPASADERVISHWRETGTGLYDAPLCFGPKYRALYERFAAQLDPIFTLTERNRGRLWMCAVREAPPPRTFALGVLEHGVPPQRVAKFHAQQLTPQGQLVTKRRALFEAYLGRLSGERERKQYLEAYAIEGDDYLVGLESERTMKELAKVADSHVEFFQGTVALCMAEQIEAMRTLRRYFKRFALPEAWGILRGLGGSQLRRWLKDEALIEAKFKQLEGTLALLVAPLVLPQRVDGVEVVELVTQYDLNREGVKMKHCVAGYGSSVAENKCRIISFRSGSRATEWATAEWVFSEDKKASPLESFGNGRHIFPLKVTLKQMRSHANTDPSEVLRNAEQQVRQSVGSWLASAGESAWDQVKPGLYAQQARARAWAAKQVAVSF